MLQVPLRCLLLTLPETPGRDGWIDQRVDEGYSVCGGPKTRRKGNRTLGNRDVQIPTEEGRRVGVKFTVGHLRKKVLGVETLSKETGLRVGVGCLESGLRDSIKKYRK